MNARTRTLLVGAAVALALFAWTHTTTLLALYVVAALLGVARAFTGPALGALAPNLVPREILPNAIALSSIAWQSGAIVGPAVGGYLYAVAPVAPYAGSALLFAVSLIALLILPKLAVARMGTALRPWHQMIEGLRYVRKNRLVLGAISLDLFAVLLGGAVALLPIFAKDILDVGFHPRGVFHRHRQSQVGALTVGYVRSLVRSSVGEFDLGADVTGYSVPANLQEPYGRPWSFHMFLRYAFDSAGATTHVH